MYVLFFMFVAPMLKYYISPLDRVLILENCIIITYYNYQDTISCPNCDLTTHSDPSYAECTSTKINSNNNNNNNLMQGIYSYFSINIYVYSNPVLYMSNIIIISILT